MNLKKYLSILTIFIICLSMVGCFKKAETKKTTLSSSVEEKSQQEQDPINTLATQKNYIVYSAEASNYFKKSQVDDYSPANVLDNDSNSSWVLNDSEKKGIGEWIKISFSDKIEVNKLYILNGLGYNSDNKKSYHKDNRVKNLEVEFSNGQKQEIDLEDDNIEEQEIVLNKPVETDYVKFTIKDIYDGNERPNLTCIGSIGINYPRVNSNEGKTNNFKINGNKEKTNNVVGFYGNYGRKDEKIKNNKKVNLSQITKYIDFKEGLPIEQKVQYLANMLVSSDESIKILKDDNNKLTAKLEGEYLISLFRDAACDGVIEKAFIEGNLLQYFYEGDDWIDSIQIDCGEETFNIDKSDFKKDFLDNKENYNYLITPKTDEEVTSQPYNRNNELEKEFDDFLESEEYLNDENLPIECNENDCYNINYDINKAVKKIESVFENIALVEPYNSNLMKYYYFKDSTYKIGYSFIIRIKGESNTAVARQCFVDAYTGKVYAMDLFYNYIGYPLSE
ncbi:discoidin domain-containing protein [Clostridium sp. 2218st1_F5_2218SCRN_220325]|uniref:discoidin domain-containing protein n=1 Tax=Clostridium sp. 2218st1_F5_2218SCRN_220325 TaxID=3143056 RepID=UPI00319DC52A